MGPTDYWRLVLMGPKMTPLPHLSGWMLSFTRRSQVSVHSQKGQGLAEYALILAFIALIVIAAVTLLGNNINDIMTNIANSI